MTIRPQYHALRDRLRRMASSPHFITARGEKEVIGRAADVIEKLCARVKQLDDTIEAMRTDDEVER